MDRRSFYVKLYILGKLDVLSLLNSTEHFVFFFQLAKTFGNTNFFSINYQHSTEFSHIGMPHFSLERVFFQVLMLRVQKVVKKFIMVSPL